MVTIRLDLASPRYFSLLAWGFGAEATRASVIDLMKS